MNGIKHLIECHCVLPQFREKKDPVFHKFVVFSVIDDEDKVIPKIVNCNNCGVSHNVIDLCKSEILLKENLSSPLTLQDIKFSLPDKVVTLLENYNVDLPTWENVKFIFDTKSWGQFVLLTSEDLEEKIEGKMLMIYGEEIYKIEPFSREIFIP